MLRRLEPLLKKCQDDECSLCLVLPKTGWLATPLSSPIRTEIAACYYALPAGMRPDAMPYCAPAPLLLPVLVAVVWVPGIVAAGWPLPLGQLPVP